MDRDGRSRVFRRCCPRRAGAASKGPAVALKFPETPLVLAGAFGGPFMIFVLTPLRNALTLGCQDSSSPAWYLYRSVFSGGLRCGWTGGLVPVPAACPQFCVMGPLFHSLNQALGSAALAVFVSASVETVISYGSQTVNAQMAFNHDQLINGREPVLLHNWLVPVGPGVFVHYIRNIVAMAGLRVISGPCQRLLELCLRRAGVELPAGIKRTFGDFAGCMASAVLSMPFAQCYNFAVTSKAYIEGSPLQRFEELGSFFWRSYLTQSASGGVTGLSQTLKRDLLMRMAYVANLFFCFGLIERLFVAVAAAAAAARQRLPRSGDAAARKGR